MPLYEVESNGNKHKIFYFCGDRAEWTRLIVKNCNKFKDVYVCDSEAGSYPKKVKIIRSKLTTKRFLGVDLKKSAVFIKASLKEIRKFLTAGWVGCDILVINVDMFIIVQGLRKNVLEISSKRNIQHYSKYK